MPIEKDKCNLCALKVIFDQNAVRGDLDKTENFITVLRDLQNEGIVETGYSRRLFASNTGVGDKSEMCAVNSKFFLTKNRNKKCPSFILNMGLSVPEALSLNVARSTDKLTSDLHRMTFVIMLLTVVAVVAAILSVCN